MHIVCVCYYICGENCLVYDIVFPCVRERSVNVSEPESLELTVSNLKPEESYSFRVIAYNDVGPGESSAPLRITTKPDRKTHTHTNKHVRTYTLWNLCPFLLCVMSISLYFLICSVNIRPYSDDEATPFFPTAVFGKRLFEDKKRVIRPFLMGRFPRGTVTPKANS